MGLLRATPRGAADGRATKLGGRHSLESDPQAAPSRSPRAKGRAPHKDDELVDGAIDSHESSVVSGDLLRSLQHATTPERWRVSFAYASQGLSVEEIARREQRPAGTIYNLLRLARLDFAAALRREAAAARGLSCHGASG